MFDPGRVRRMKVCLGTAALAPAVAAVLSIALLSLLSPAFSPSGFWPWRVGIMLAHQFAGALVAVTVVALGLPVRLWPRVAAGAACFVLSFPWYAAAFVAIRSVAAEVGFDLG